MLRRLAPATPSPAVDAAALVIRVIVGPIMASHGWNKIDGGVGNFAQYVGTLGVPFPDVVARLVVLIEFAGGIFLVLGLLTRLWALLLAVQMLSIVFVVKWEIGLLGQQGRTGFELDLVIAACALGLLLIGPGRFALDHLLPFERAPGERPRATAGPAVRT